MYTEYEAWTNLMNVSLYISIIVNIYSNKTCRLVVHTHNLLCCLVIGMHRFGTDRIMLDTVTTDERPWQVDRPI